MAIDFEKLTKVLNSSAYKIKEASDISQENPAQAFNFVPVILNELQSCGNLKEAANLVVHHSRKDDVYAAIKLFFKNTKDAQEKAGAVGAALFGSPQFKELAANLEQVKRTLEKKKVEKPSEGQGI